MLETQPVKADIGDYGELILTWVVALALLSAITWLIVRLAGTFLASARARGRPGGRGPIRVLAQVSLGGEHGLHVVEVGGKTLLLATGARGVRLLSEVDGAVVEDALAAGARRRYRPFHVVLADALARRAPSGASSPATSPNKDADLPDASREERPDQGSGQ